MRVNSVLISLFRSHRVARTGIVVAALTTFFIGSSFTKHPDPDLRIKEVNLMIRQIGHNLLLQAGDSTSRVLPVTERKEGTFLLKFENELAFSHNSLMELAEGSLPKSEFPSGYTVTVLDCTTDDIIYGFQLSNTLPDKLPCKGRKEPSGCYTIEFDFPDLYDRMEAGKAKPDMPPQHSEPKKEDPQQSKSVRVEPQPVTPEPVFLKTPEVVRQTEKSTSINLDLPEVNVKLEESKTKTVELNNLVYGGLLVLMSITFLIGRFSKASTPPLLQKQVGAWQDQPSVIKESVPELPALGKFSFDEKAQRLLLGSEVISLTDKECKILELFNHNFGELISRETLIQKIWIDDGVITGRSLDMFVSKLRKKLSGDPELRITNVHGKGYRLEIVSGGDHLK